MPKRLTNEEFINKAILKHGDKYNYDGVEYKDSKIKIDILCNTCKNIFQHIPSDHLSGKGCSFCTGNKKSSTTDFINKAIFIHRNKYNYDNVNYTNNHTKVEIICNTCNNEFQQKPTHHLSGHGCMNCGGSSKSYKEEFINKAILKHGNKYNYDSVVYINNSTKVEILCNTCKNIFEQTPLNHLSGQRCSNCYGTKKSSTKDFINKSILKHGNKYNYDSIVYVNNYTKVEIICNTCMSIFQQTPHNHLSGQGCPTCNKKGGYCDRYFEKFPERKNIPGLIYLNKFVNLKTNEIFYKLGITIGDRQFGKKYEVTTIKEVNMTIYEAFLKEQELLKKFIHLKHRPQIKFDGRRECFTEELLEQLEIKELFGI